MNVEKSVIWLMLLIVFFFVVFMTITLPFLMAGDMVPPQDVEPKASYITEWIIAISALAGTVLTGIGIFIKKRKK